MADTEQTQTEQDAATATETTETTQTTDQLGESGKAALEKERQRAKDAEKRAKEAEKRLADIDAQNAAKEEADAKARGEFEKLANERQSKIEKLTTEYQSVTAERDALAERVQSYEDRDKSRLEAALKDLPDDLRVTDPINFDPDVSLTARLKWLDVQQGTAAKRTTDPVRGNGRSPESANGRDAKADEAAREAQARTFHSRF